jgi:hypothetical protein
MGNLLTQSKTFRKLVDWAYGVCDDKKTGHIGQSELYAGLLLVHVKLAKFVGPAACFVRRLAVGKILQLFAPLSRFPLFLSPP